MKEKITKLLNVHKKYGSIGFCKKLKSYIIANYLDKFSFTTLVHYNKYKKEIKEIKIQKEVVDPDDVEMLQDLILGCVNEALRKVDSAQAAQLGKYNIPGIM